MAPDTAGVGVPRHADDSANAVTEAALRFSRQLHGRFRLPVATIDERLSSWEAEQRHIRDGPAGHRRRARCGAGRPGGGGDSGKLV
jgi:putative Holliday junction resolvase